MSAAIILLCIVTLLTLLTWVTLLTWKTRGSWAVAEERSGPGGDGPGRTAGSADEISDDERREYDRAVMDEMTWRD